MLKIKSAEVSIGGVFLMSWMDRVVEAVTVATITVVLLVMLVLSFALVMEVLSAMGWV